MALHARSIRGSGKKNVVAGYGGQRLHITHKQLDDE